MKHILIDFENIQPTSLDMIDDPENYHVWLFLGVHQQKILPYPLTKSLFRFASQYVHFVEMQRTGKNALDHYLAFYLGKISQIDKNAQICILARDSGYDILVEHLNATHQGLQIQRFSELQNLQQKSNVYIEGNNISYEPIEPIKQEKVSSANLSDNQALFNQAINVLKTKFNKNRPTKKTALINSLASHLKLTQQQAEKLIANLEKNKKIIIPPQGKITYHL